MRSWPTETFDDSWLDSPRFGRYDLQSGTPEMPIGPTEQGTMDLNSRFNVSYALNRCVVMRATFMAAIVGTVLVLINHGMCIYSGHFGFMCFCQTVLTFMVPYVVSTVSSVLAMSDSDNKAVDMSTVSQKPSSS